MLSHRQRLCVLVGITERSGEEKTTTAKQSIVLNVLLFRIKSGAVQVPRCNFTALFSSPNVEDRTSPLCSVDSKRWPALAACDLWWEEECGCSYRLNSHTQARSLARMPQWWKKVFWHDTSCDIHYCENPSLIECHLFPRRCQHLTTSSRCSVLSCFEFHVC